MISAINNPQILEWIEHELQKRQPDNAAQPDSAHNPGDEEIQNHFIKNKLLNKPFREKFDPDAMKREQGWKGQHDKAEIFRLIKEMDVTEPIELLISQLTK
jgi:hypothetical protein